MSFMGTMLGSIAGRAAIPLIAAGGFGAYKSGAMNGLPIPGMAPAPSHFEMQARITNVKNACHLRYRANGKLRQTEALECDRAVSMLQKPDFAGYSLHKAEQVTYSYFSMDGTSTLHGTINRGHDANGRRYRKNDVITIRVDSSDHSKSKVI